MPFFRHCGHPFFIHQHRTTWILHWRKCMVFYWRAQKSSHYIPLSAKMQKDIDGERKQESQRPVGNVKQFSKSGINNSIAGQNICLLASVPVSKLCEHSPIDIEGLQYNLILFLYSQYYDWRSAPWFHHLFALWWTLVRYEMHAKRGHDK